jgi:F0F1-type ATP synthase membrane subunit b/b'
VQLNISHEDLRQSLEEQEATVGDLRREAEEACKALDSERKQVEGDLHFYSFSFVDLACSRSTPDFCYFVVGSGLRTALGNTTTQAEAVQTAYNSSQQELEELQAATFEVCQEVEEGEAQAGSSLASRLRALGGHVS